MPGSCNTTIVWDSNCQETQVVIGVTVMLAISLILNICFAVKYCSGKETCCSRKRRRSSSRQVPSHMEENPIYGNLNFTETEAEFTEVEPPHSSLSSQSLRDQHRVKPASQDCYANLNLKAPRAPAARSSQPIEYSDVVHLEEPAEKEDDVVTGDVSPVSELYASVQTQRSKTIDAADGDESYANHL